MKTEQRPREQERHRENQLAGDLTTQPGAREAVNVRPCGVESWDTILLCLLITKAYPSQQRTLAGRSDTSNSSGIYTMLTARRFFPRPHSQGSTPLGFRSSLLLSQSRAKQEEGRQVLKQQQQKQLWSLGRAEQAEITSRWEEGVGLPFLFCWIHLDEESR